MNDNKTYTVAEAAALPDESWVNGTLEAHCIKIETIAKKAPKTGNFYKAHLSDGGSEALASMSLFMAPKFQAGDIIRLSGSGVKKGSYNGKAQFSTGKDTNIDVSPGQQKVMAAAHGAHAEQANGELISGQQVGLAMKEALALRSIGHTTTIDQLLTSPGFWYGVYETASDIIRVARMLEKGSLADPVKTRQPQQRGSVQPQRASSTVEQELDEDVPF
jgi:hypothetical protein